MWRAAGGKTDQGQLRKTGLRHCIHGAWYAGAYERMAHRPGRDFCCTVHYFIQLARSKKHGTAIAGLILSVLAIIATCVYILLIVMSADIMTDSRWYDDENFIRNERPEIEYNLENPGDL